MHRFASNGHARLICRSVSAFLEQEDVVERRGRRGGQFSLAGSHLDLAGVRCLRVFN